MMPNNTPREEEWGKALDKMIQKYDDETPMFEEDNRTPLNSLIKVFILNLLAQERAATEQRMRAETESKLREVYNFVVLTSGKNGRKDILKYIDQALNEMKGEK